MIVIEYFRSFVTSYVEGQVSEIDEVLEECSRGVVSFADCKTVDLGQDLGEQELRSGLITVLEG